MVQQWQDWLAAHTDTLLALDERARLHGTPDDVADVAAAFVARKAISDRVAEISAAGSQPGAVAALADQPVTDSSGQHVAVNLRAAGELLDAIVRTVSARVDGSEQRGLDEIRLAADAEAALNDAEPLAAQLQMSVNVIADLRRRLAARAGLAEVAGESTELLTELRAAAAERDRLLSRAAAVPQRLADLAEREREVRELAERCRQRVVQTPRLGIPDVSVLEQAPPLDQLQQMGFTALRGTVNPVLAKLDRLGDALAEAERRFREPLTRRDELRGLLQAFRDKAAARGHGEHAELEPMYRAAADVLWSAPSDLAAAAPLVDAYVQRVNEVTR
jgi:hypothetical protein